MASQRDVHKRAMHIMIDAMKQPQVVLEYALDDLGATFSQQPDQRKRLIDIALRQAKEELQDPVMHMRRELMKWTETYGESAVSLAWAELIGSGHE